MWQEDGRDGFEHVEALTPTMLAMADTLCIRNFMEMWVLTIDDRRFLLSYPPRVFKCDYRMDDIHGATLIQHDCIHGDDEPCECEPPLLTKEAELPSAHKRIYSLLGRLRDRVRMGTGLPIDVQPVYFDAADDYALMAWTDKGAWRADETLTYQTRYTLDVSRSTLFHLRFRLCPAAIATCSCS